MLTAVTRLSWSGRASATSTKSEAAERPLLNIKNQFLLGFVLVIATHDVEGIPQRPVICREREDLVIYRESTVVHPFAPGPVAMLNESIGVIS